MVLWSRRLRLGCVSLQGYLLPAHPTLISTHARLSVCVCVYLREYTPVRSKLWTTSQQSVDPKPNPPNECVCVCVRPPGVESIRGTGHDVAGTRDRGGGDSGRSLACGFRRQPGRASVDTERAHPPFWPARHTHTHTHTHTPSCPRAPRSSLTSPGGRPSRTSCA